MKRLWNVLILFIALTSVVHAQIDRAGLAWRDHIYNRSATQVARFTPFNLASGPDLSQFNPEITYLKVNTSELDRLLIENPADLQITIPNSNGSPMMVDLYPSGILANDFSAWTPDPNAPNGVRKFNNPHNGLHYWGTVAGYPNTTVAFSFFPNEIMGVVMTPEGNYNIGILNTEKAGDKNALYVLYNDRLSTTKNPFSCQVGDAPVKMKQEDINAFASTTCKVVRIYFEADKDLHDKRGGVANTVTFITGFFNVVGAVYANEAISLELGDIKVWDTPDPYITFTTTNEFLTEFRNNQIPPNPFTWNLAHLVSTRLNIGGLAGLDVLCHNDRRRRSGFSAIFNSFQPLPTYSWTVLVVSHELGHNFSSPHTHNCGWPGGAIDGCEATEGGCFRPPNANPGTIMSYCHIPTSIDLNLGFGPFPGNRIRRAYQNATCLPTSTVTATITSPASPFRLCQGNNVTLNAQTCTGCNYQWQRNGTNINGATSASYTTNQEGTYTVVVRRFACRAVSEPVSVVLVTPPCNPANGNVTGGVSLACVSTPSGTLTLSGHTGTVLRWESSTDNFANVTTINSTTTTITYPALNQTTCYRAVINNGGTTYSQPNCIVIAQPPSVTAGVDARSLCQDSVATLWATSPNAISFSWQPATGLNNPNVSHPFLTLTVSTTYTVTVTDNNGCTNSASVVVTLSPTAGQATVANGALCIGDQAQLTLDGPIDGSITWQQRVNCTGSWVTATGTGVNTPNFTSNAYTQSGSMCYRARLTQGTCVYITNTVTVTVCGDIRFTCTNLSYSNQFNNWFPSTPNANTCVGGNAIGWTNDSSVPGWYAVALGGGSMFYNAQPGGCGAEGFSTYGMDGSTERNLGTWNRTSNPTNPAIGSKCRNNTGGTITSIRVQYTGEQWFRSTTANILDRLDFQYSTDATALNNGTWTDHDPLDFITPQRSNIGALDGNLPQHQTVFDQTITGLNIPNGATFWLRWVDFNQNSLTTQDMLGIDNLTYTVTFTGGLTAPTNVTGPPEHCANEDQTYTVSPVTGSGTVRYNWTIPGGCTGWSLQSPNNTPATTMVIRAGAGNCSGITVTATDDCGTSAPYNFNINLGSCLPSNGGTLSAAQTICSGQTPAQLSVTGHVGTILRWESSINCPGFTSPTTITNTNATYTPPPLTQTTCFRVVVQNNNRPSANSNIVTVTVDPVSVGGALTANQTICNGGTPAAFNLSGQTGAVLRWESSTNNFITVTTINNTNTTYSPGILMQTTCYRAVVRSGVCPPANSSSVCVTIDAPATPTATGGGTYCINENFTLNVTNPQTGTYRWYDAPSGGNLLHTGTNYPTSISSAGTFNFYVEHTSTFGCTSARGVVTVTIQNCSGNGGNVTSNQTVCQGSPASMLNLTGHTGTVVRWESSTDNFATVTTINNTNTTYNPGILGQNTCFRAVVLNTPPEVFSTPACVTIVNQGIAGAVNSDQTVCSGDAVTLTLTGHNGTIIRWESSTDNFVTVTTINNLNDTYSFTAGVTIRYRAVIQNSPCTPIFSTSASITVNPCGSNGGNVTADQTVCTGSPANTLTLSGHTGNVIRWESSTDNFTTVTTINNTNTTYDPGILTQNTCFRAVVLDLPPVAFSTPACITLTNNPPAGTVSSDMTVCSDANTGTLTLSGHSGNVLYWEFSTDNFITVTTINNTTTTYTFNNLTENTRFRAWVQSTGCPAVASASAFVVVTNPPLGGTITSNQTLCPGKIPTLLRLINFRGAVVRWESSTDNFVTVTTINNTVNTYNPGVVMQTTSFRAVVQNPCSTVYSGTVQITVISGNGGTLSQDMTICATPANGTLTVTGYSGTIQAWEGSTDNFITVQPYGINTPTFNFTNLTTTTKFRVRVLDGSCLFYSNAVQVTVIPAPKGGTMLSNQTICEGQNASVLILTSFSGNVIRWESSTDNFATITTISNTTAVYNPNPVNQTTSYRAVVGRAGCTDQYSSIATITLGSGANGGILSSDQTICSGTAPSVLTLTGHSGTILRWESSGDNFVSLSTINNTQTTYQPPILTQSRAYRAVVKNGSCGNAYSSIVNITVNGNAEGGQVNSDQTVCSGNPGAPLTLMGYTGNVVRWESSTDNFALNVTPIANNTNTHLPGILTATTWFRAVVQEAGCAEVNSGAVRIQVNPGPVGGNVINNQTVCSGQMPTILTVVGFSGTIVQWESSTDNFVTVNVIPNTNSTYNPGILANTTAFRVRIANGSCPDAYATPATITVVSNIAVGGAVTTNMTLCSNDPNTYTLNLSGHLGNVIRWEASEDDFLSISSFANTNTSHQFAGLRNTTKFRAVVGVPGCNVVYSTPATITILSPQENGILANVGNGQVSCANNTGTLMLNNYNGTISHWESSTDNFVTITNIPNNTNTYAYSVAVPTRFRVAINHPVCGLIYSPVLEVSPGISINLEAWRECNATGKIVATATGGSLPYIYTISPQAGLQSQVGIFTGLPVGTYTVTVRDRFNCTASATIAIPGTVTPPRITTVTTIGNTAARVIWDIVAPGGVNVVYQVQHRPVGSPTWSTPLQVNSNIATISGLIPNTQYEVQVRVRCLPSTIWGAWSPSTIFRTAVREGWMADDAVSNIQIYPNPNKGSFVIQLNSPKSEIAQIHIYDMQGKMIHSLETTSDENTINIPEITSGVYLIRVIQSGQSKTVKMVVE
jgi:hypothetical protein